MDVTITKGFTQKTCKGCGVVFYIPEELERKYHDEPNTTWYCPNGHPYCYSETDSVKYKRLYEAEKLEKEKANQYRKNAIESAEYYMNELDKCKAKKKTKRVTK